jgi:DNA polymerase III psi subunit
MSNELFDKINPEIIDATQNIFKHNLYNNVDELVEIRNIREKVEESLPSLPKDQFAVKLIDNEAYIGNLEMSEFVELWRPIIISFIESGDIIKLIRVGLPWDLKVRNKDTILGVALEELRKINREGNKNSSRDSQDERFLKLNDQMIDLIDHLITLQGLSTNNDNDDDKDDADSDITIQKGNIENTLQHVLLWASIYDLPEIVSYLLQQGVNPNATERNPLVQAIIESIEFTSLNETIKVLLEDPRTDPTIVEEESTESALTLINKLIQYLQLRVSNTDITTNENVELVEEVETLIPSLETESSKNLKELLNLFRKLENTINKTDPTFHKKVLNSKKLRVPKMGALPSLHRTGTSQSSSPYLSKSVKGDQTFKRSRWQSICEILAKDFAMEELRQIAKEYGIKNISRMSKRELCKTISESPAAIVEQLKNNIPDLEEFVEKNK